MAKDSLFVCQQCGSDFPKWSGQCPNCHEWNTLVETSLRQGYGRQAKSRKMRKSGSTAVKLGRVKTAKSVRISTRISELDRVLGGGLVPGQVVLLAGEPGIGKSTLLLQIAANFKNVGYIAGEESPYQIKLRSARVAPKAAATIIPNTNVDEAISELSRVKNVDLIVVDSIQTIYTDDLSGMAGSVGQVRESSLRLINYAKSKNIPLFIVGHVTKEGAVAGPATLIHMVDTVCWFEGDEQRVLRLIKCTKNRFGATDEIGVFQMEGTGLKALENTDNLFVTDLKSRYSGTIVTSLMEGTRPILVEIQSLVSSTSNPYPKRVAQGFDKRRLEILLAILTRRLSLPFYEWDVYVNIVGGIRIDEPASDLAICCSLISALKDKALPPDIAAFGEVGLLGEVRKVSFNEKRMAQAKRLGYKNIISPDKYPHLKDVYKALFK